MSAEIHERIAVLRQRTRDNALTINEMREAVVLMRGDRERAAKVSAKARAPKEPKQPKEPKAAKTAKKPIDTDALLSQLDF